MEYKKNKEVKNAAQQGKESYPKTIDDRDRGRKNVKWMGSTIGKEGNT